MPPPSLAIFLTKADAFSFTVVDARNIEMTRGKQAKHVRIIVGYNM